MYTERQTAKLANEIYRLWRLGRLTDAAAAALLDKLVPTMSTAQFHKHSDFIYAIRNNPNFYQKKA